MQKTSLLRITAWIGALVCLPIAARAAEVFKANNSDNLNSGTSWTGGNPPGPLDVAVWNATVQSETVVALGADLGWLGLRIANPTGSVTVGAGNVLTLGAGGIDLGSAAADLTFGADVTVGASQNWTIGAGRTLTLGGLLAGGATNQVAKQGAGTLLSTSTANGTYAGGLTVNGGVVQIQGANNNNGSSLGVGTLTNNGATLRFGASVIVGNPVDFRGLCTVDVNGFSGGGLLSGAWSGDGVVNLTNLVAGATFTAGGNGLGGGTMSAFTGTVNLGTNAGTFRFNNGGGNNNVGNAGATFDLGTGSAIFLSRNRNAAVNLGVLKGGPNTSIKQGSSSSGTTTYSIGAKNVASTFAGTIADGGSTSAGLIALAKLGTNTLTLTGPNTYGGGTTISAGTLQVGDGGASGTLGVGPVVNNATLVFSRSDPFEVANAISGPGLLIQLGTGVLTLTGANTSSGETWVNQGTLAIGGSGSISGPLAVARGATLDVSGAPGFTLSQVLSGVGTVSGTLTAGNNAILSPAGNGAAGTLTLANGLVETGGVVNRLDLSNDPTGKSKTNDLIKVVGDLTLSGVNSVVVNPLNGSVPAGNYPLIQYSGTLNGTLDNLAVSGVNGILTNSSGLISLIVRNSRQPRLEGR
jgi:fibronectin-binding autotransporter adhesin